MHPTKGDFNGFVKQKTTIFKINVTAKPKNITVSVGGKSLKIAEVNSLEAFNKNSNGYFYNAAPNLNQFATSGSSFEKVSMIKNPQVWVKVAPVNITTSDVVVKIEGFKFQPKDNLKVHTGSLAMPVNVQVAGQ